MAICSATSITDHTSGAGFHFSCFALSPDTRRILEGMGHRFGASQPANHVAAILVGAPALGARPVENKRYYGAKR